MIEFLVEVLGEVLIQLVGELLVELGGHALPKGESRKPADPWLATLFYAVIGALLGWLSLLVFPTHLTPVGLWRGLNLIASPVLAGLCMSLLGAWRKGRGQELIRLDRFLCGFVFALAFALVRFFLAR
jgi:hypothetical protein